MTENDREISLMAVNDCYQPLLIYHSWIVIGWDFLKHSQPANLICHPILSLQADLHGQYFLAILLSNAISRPTYCRARQYPRIEKFLLKLHCWEISQWSCQDKAIKKPWNLIKQQQFSVLWVRNYCRYAYKV